MADTSMYENIMNRHTCRNYERDYEIPANVMKEIIDTALNSPFISEPDTNQIEFIVCTNRAKNQEAAEAQLEIFPQNVQDHLLSRKTQFGVENVMSCDASAEVIVYCRKENIVDNEKMNIDAGLAIMSICIASRAFGLETMCQGVMVGSGTAKVYGIPEDSIILGVAIGKAREGAHIPSRKIKNEVRFLE
ncbi:nitroreductase family protein [Tritrichomonas foetus]|uniref:Nitroreductase family protein n=1 Tax=Tritrichomonas foetus TaxID=1144522 RepID=A0A1J4K8K2_9EUKA|nr:nitroreductase family protein [Tritrichomonas foetus]|eukprot:OHT05998.1 nitroreductase family protein [Tritrichomonas foetus]